MTIVEARAQLRLREPRIISKDELEYAISGLGACVLDRTLSMSKRGIS